MYANPINLALRFLLELAALAAYGYWGWTQHQGLSRWLWAVGLPLLAAVLWGTFRVPNDPGPAPVAVPGQARLLLEALVFGGAVFLLAAAGRPIPAARAGAAILGGLLVLHYLVSYDRVLRLLGRG
jgi:hypothetical protein